MNPRYHRIDGWRGYSIPALAIVGASDTGGGSDSPCPTASAKAELARFQREALRPLGISSRTRMGGSSNVFCGKRWLVVKRASFDTAARAAIDWLKKHQTDTRYIHSADLEKLGYEEV